jgi:hypothetical protein
MLTLTLDICTDRQRRAVEVSIAAGMPLAAWPRPTCDGDRSAEEWCRAYLRAARGAGVTVRSSPDRHAVNVAVVAPPSADIGRRPCPVDLGSASMARLRADALRRTPQASDLLDRAVERLYLGGRERASVARMARGIAALMDSEYVHPCHVAEALSYRMPR